MNQNRTKVTVHYVEKRRVESAANGNVELITINPQIIS